MGGEEPVKLIACGNCGHAQPSDSVRCPKGGQGDPGLRANCPDCAGSHVLIKRLNAAPSVIGRDGREPLPPIATVLKAANFKQLEFLCRSCSHLWRPTSPEVAKAFERAEEIVQEAALERQADQPQAPRSWLDRIKDQTIGRFTSN